MSWSAATMQNHDISGRISGLKMISVSRGLLLDHFKRAQNRSRLGFDIISDWRIIKLS